MDAADALCPFVYFPKRVVSAHGAAFFDFDTIETTVKLNYSLKDYGYNEMDRKIEEKELKTVTGDKNATLTILDDKTLVHEYTTEKNIGYYWRNMEDCTINHE